MLLLLALLLLVLLLLLLVLHREDGMCHRAVEEEEAEKGCVEVGEEDVCHKRNNTVNM